MSASAKPLYSPRNLYGELKNSLEYGAFHTEDNWTIAFHQGNAEALEIIFNAYHERLYHFARRFVVETPEAEDITSEAFMKLWERRKHFDGLPSMVMFLHKTVKNRCLDVLKHRQVKSNRHAQLQQVLENTADGDFLVEMIRLELMKRIYGEVSRLPAKTREVFLLSYRDGLKPSEIAAQLKLSVQTVKNQRVTALKLLRETFQNDPLILILLALLEQEIQFFS